MTSILHISCKYKITNGQFNNIIKVKGSHEMNAVHLLKTYCLSLLTVAYGLDNAVSLSVNDLGQVVHTECASVVRQNNLVLPKD